MAHKKFKFIGLGVFVVFALIVFVTLKFDLYYKVTYKEVPHDKAIAYAKQMIGYSMMVERAVNKMLENGIDETQLCFDYDGIGKNTDYFEHDACMDPKNQVFWFDGGQIAYQFPGHPDAHDPVHHTGRSYKRWWFNAAMPVHNIGTEQPELLMSVNYLKKEVCLAINELLGITPEDEDIPSDTSSRPSLEAVKFHGIFGEPLENIIGDEAASLDGRHTACRRTGENYQFFHVLIAR
ncbi:MAG: hypothetical protein CMH32_01055 [Micavibrio sp.]|nr:hypothetical protein [Micavibrio sp.]|tara:strand:- start:252 stop:959 length:708 start_codon:yes stop_codon:yes gene_type:complete